MPMNSDRLIIGPCNINNALAGDCRKMWSFFFFRSLIEANVSLCVVSRIFNSSVKFSMALKPLHACHSSNEFSSSCVYLSDLLSFRMSYAKWHCGLIYMLKIFC